MASVSTFKGWPHKESFDKFCVDHIPFQSHATGFPNCLESIMEFLKSNNSLTDISCAEIDGVFYGNPSCREKVDMKASDFVDAWNNAKINKLHWTVSSGLNLYLSQHSLPKASECSSIFHCPVPSILEDVVMDRMNLWMNVFFATSTLHYDANNNILIVLEGHKDITLFSPSCTKLLKPAAAHNEYPNHSALTPAEADQLATTLREVPGTDYVAHTVTLLAGDALFIPEGWWHQVRSQKCTMALNFWFHSDMRPLLLSSSQDDHADTHTGVDMSSYILRAALRKAISAQKLADKHRQTPIHGTESCTKESGNVSPYPEDMTYDQFCCYVQQCLFLGKDREDLAAVGNKRKRCSDADPWTAFVSCDIHIMRKFWIPFANKHPQQWTELLLSLSPKAADQLLSYWDSLEDDGDESRDPSDEAFFHGIFSPCGDAVPQVRQHLIAQKDKNNELYAMQVLRDILGITGRDITEK